MFCWGSTINGELGLGAQETEHITLPIFNNVKFGVKQVSSGLTVTLFLTEDGFVYSCGSNEGGQLGREKKTQKPELIDALKQFHISQLACGDQHSLALTLWGMVYSWGENVYGQLGLDTEDYRVATPKLVKSLTKKKVVQVACGSYHSLALTADGEVYSWGHNAFGQLGMVCGDKVRIPIKINALCGVPLRIIVAGGYHSLALTDSGLPVTWGSNKYGQLGRTVTGHLFCSMPKVVPNLESYSEPLRYASAGENHTVILDSLGKLWTFGLGSCGQLGHGNFYNQSVPTPVLDLFGSKVSQVACGRAHTIVYIPAQGKLLAFGQGINGQLGIITPQNCSSPQVVLGPWQTPTGRPIAEEPAVDNPVIFVKNVFAGGDTTFALISKWTQNSLDYCLNCPFQEPFKIEEDKIDEMLAIGEEDMVDDDLFTYAEHAFSSLSCWSMSFLKQPVSKTSHGLDYRLAEQYMAKLGRINRASLVDVINNGIRSAIADIPSYPCTTEVLRVFIIFPLWKGFINGENYGQFQGPYTQALCALCKDSCSVIKDWLRTLPLDFIRLLVTQLKNVLVFILGTQYKRHNECYLSRSRPGDVIVIESSLKVLQILYRENKKFFGNKGHLIYEEFYIPELTEWIDFQHDYVGWLEIVKYGGGRAVVSFCEYPFVFDAVAKTHLLRVDANRQMQGAVDQAVWNRVYSIYNIYNLYNDEANISDVGGFQFYNLYVHRNNLLSDTLGQLIRPNVGDLKKPLKVHFINEEAEDAGGVRKEFFLLLIRDLLNPDFSMFVENKESRTMWFKAVHQEADFNMFLLIGMICGLAIYNCVIINLPFPLALYKKLLDEPVNIDDLEELDPVLVRSLRQLLEYEGDVTDAFGLNFSTVIDNFGEIVPIPLKYDGENISVTNDNRQEYVDALVDWRLNSGTKIQFEAFKTGFFNVIGTQVIKLFQPLELQSLVTGNENYDWMEFQRNSVYEGVYFVRHPVIIMFWEVFHELSLDQKKDFLMFLTGTPRIPILGMKAISITFCSSSDDNYLPVAHTCVGQLDLPLYRTKEKLRLKLLQAIQQSEGFGLV